MASTSSSSRIPPTYLANTSLALGTFITLNNTYALINPRAALTMLGFTLPSSPGDQKLVLGLMRMFAATRVALGFSGVAMWWYKDYRAMGWSMLAGLIMAGVDGWVSKEVIGKGEWGHWGAAPISLVVGVGLLSLVGI